MNTKFIIFGVPAIKLYVLDKVVQKLSFKIIISWPWAMTGSVRVTFTMHRNPGFFGNS